MDEGYIYLGRVMCKAQINKRCSVCNIEKPINDFYEIKAKCEIKIRWEKKCKACKKKQREFENSENNNANRPKGVIEPENIKKLTSTNTENTPSGVIELRNNETNSLVKTIDFEPLEILCEKKLNEYEKYDAIQGFNEFISILREEYGKMQGKYVYIK